MNISDLYNPSNVQADSAGEYEALPPGWYDVTIEAAEVRPTAAGGTMLSVTFTVDGPSHIGRKLWGNYNLAHPTSRKAVEIGHSQLKALHESCGIPDLSNTDQLYGGRCAVRVALRKDDATKNEVKGARSLTGGAGAAGSAPRSAPPAARPPAAGPPRPAGPPKAGPPRAAAPPAQDDDLPI